MDGAPQALYPPREARMKDPLVRFGIAIEQSLLEDIDALVEERGCTRSELFRDLARSEVSRKRAAGGAEAVASLTLVYDHHVRDLTEKLTELQHELGEMVRSTLHVHLSHDYCLEVLVLRGHADELAAIAQRILATKGVKHGGIEVIAGVFEHGSADHEHVPRPRPARKTRARR
jgi:CopG family nickel-responsive transcriptional regulator